MQVEATSRRDVLDMTWIAVREALELYPIFTQLQAGRGLTSEQNIFLQRRAKGEKLSG